MIQKRMPFEFFDTDFPGVKVVCPEVFNDDRGVFMETYVKESFSEEGIDTEFVQDNYSESESGVLRGLHYQRGDAAQAKLVQCIRGEVFDVIADLRTDSPTFGESMSMTLSEQNRKMLYVPRGFAHGFFTLSDEAATRYKLDNNYVPEKEAGVRWDDPELAINWPVDSPLLSEKDKHLPTLEQLISDNLVF